MISDIHLGQGGGISVLTRPRPLAALLDALDSYDRLVLLGDTIEMQESHPSQSFPIAEPVLRRIAERLGPEKQVLLVPGNHDHGLVRDWARQPARGWRARTRVPANASLQLERVVSWLEATRVEVHYPGVWLGDGIWATHGHYLNHYLRPVSSYGLHPPTGVDPATPAEFEYVARTRRPSRICATGCCPSAGSTATCRPGWHRSARFCSIARCSATRCRRCSESCRRWAWTPTG